MNRKRSPSSQLTSTLHVVKTILDGSFPKWAEATQLYSKAANLTIGILKEQDNTRQQNYIFSEIMKNPVYGFGELYLSNENLLDKDIIESEHKFFGQYPSGYEFKLLKDELTTGYTNGWECYYDKNKEQYVLKSYNNNILTYIYLDEYRDFVHTNTIDSITSTVIRVLSCIENKLTFVSTIEHRIDSKVTPIYNSDVEMTYEEWIIYMGDLNGNMGSAYELYSDLYIDSFDLDNDGVISVTDIEGLLGKSISEIPELVLVIANNHINPKDAVVTESDIELMKTTRINSVRIPGIYFISNKTTPLKFRLVYNDYKKMAVIDTDIHKKVELPNGSIITLYINGSLYYDNMLLNKSLPFSNQYVIDFDLVNDHLYIVACKLLLNTDNSDPEFWQLEHFLSSLSHNTKLSPKSTNKPPSRDFEELSAQVTIEYDKTDIFNLDLYSLECNKLDIRMPNNFDKKTSRIINLPDDHIVLISDTSIWIGEPKYNKLYRTSEVDIDGEELFTYYSLTEEFLDEEKRIIHKNMTHLDSWGKNLGMERWLTESLPQYKNRLRKMVSLIKSGINLKDYLSVRLGTNLIEAEYIIKSHIVTHTKLPLFELCHLYVNMGKNSLLYRIEDQKFLLNNIVIGYYDKGVVFITNKLNELINSNGIFLIKFHSVKDNIDFEFVANINKINYKPINSEVFIEEIDVDVTTNEYFRNILRKTVYNNLNNIGSLVFGKTNLGSISQDSYQNKGIKTPKFSSDIPLLLDFNAYGLYDGLSFGDLAVKEYLGIRLQDIEIYGDESLASEPALINIIQELSSTGTIQKLKVSFDSGKFIRNGEIYIYGDLSLSPPIGNPYRVYLTLGDIVLDDFSSLHIEAKYIDKKPEYGSTDINTIYDLTGKINLYIDKTHLSSSDVYIGFDTKDNFDGNVRITPSGHMIVFSATDQNRQYPQPKKYELVHTGEYILDIYDKSTQTIFADLYFEKNPLKLYSYLNQGILVYTSDKTTFVPELISSRIDNDKIYLKSDIIKQYNQQEMIGLTRGQYILSVDDNKIATENIKNTKYQYHDTKDFIRINSRLMRYDHLIMNASDLSSTGKLAIFSMIQKIVPDEYILVDVFMFPKRYFDKLSDRYKYLYKSNFFDSYLENGKKDYIKTANLFEKGSRGNLDMIGINYNQLGTQYVIMYLICPMISVDSSVEYAYELGLE